MPPVAGAVDDTAPAVRLDTHTAQGSAPGGETGLGEGAHLKRVESSSRQSGE